MKDFDESDDEEVGAIENSDEVLAEMYAAIEGEKLTNNLSIVCLVCSLILVRYILFAFS